MPYRPSGSWVAIPTPFDDQNRIDYDVFAEIISFHARHGTSALLVLGSCGEATLLTHAERREVIRRVSALAQGKLPAFFGITSPGTQDTVELGRYAEECGAGGVVLTVPPYLNAPQEAVYEFFDTVMAAVRIPVGVYNNPARVAVNIEPATIARLAEKHPHFVADKEAMPRNSQLIEVMELTGGKLHVLCCDYPGYSIALTTMAMGGHGLANIGGNVIPAEMAAMARPWQNWEDAVRTRELYFRYLPLLRKLYAVTNPVIVKGAMRILGFKVGKPRSPLPDMMPEKVLELERLMHSLGIVETYAVRH